MPTRQIFNGIFSETRSLQDLSQDKNICSEAFRTILLVNFKWFHRQKSCRGTKNQSKTSLLSHEEL